MADTFSEAYAFVGPSIVETETAVEGKGARKKIYISLGTVLNQNADFYQNCFRALENEDLDVVMSVGDKTDLASLGKIPPHFMVKNRVNQIEVLQQADLFITHCGMNSVNESLYFGVPMVLFPQHSEEGVVANRAAELGAGVILKGYHSHSLNETVKIVLEDESFQKNAAHIGDSFKKAGGAKAAAAFIEGKIIK